MNARLYARVSHANDDQDPANQLVPLRQFAKARGWKILEEYVDRASAVDLRKRTAWARLMADAEASEIVAVWRLDRAFRSTLHAARDIEALKAKGAKFVSTTEGFDLTTNGGQLMFDVMAAFAAAERRTISERIRIAKALARKSGRPLGGFPRGRKRRGVRGKMES